MGSAGIPRWGISANTYGYYLHYVGTTGVDRVRVMAQFSQPVNLPGLDPIPVTAGDTLLVELGPPDPDHIDTDNDGMPDWWETLHGLNPGSSSDAGIDSDKDGLNNLQEYVAGCDPTNARSVFGFTGGATVQGNKFVVRWPSISNRFYDVSRSTNLATGANGFFILPGASNMPATPTENSYTDAVQAVGPFFYKIDVHE